MRRINKTTPYGLVPIRVKRRWEIKWQERAWLTIVQDLLVMRPGLKKVTLFSPEPLLQLILGFWRSLCRATARLWWSPRSLHRTSPGTSPGTPSSTPTGPRTSLTRSSTPTYREFAGLSHGKSIINILKYSPNYSDGGSLLFDSAAKIVPY